MVTSEEVLRQLDDCQAAYRFPILVGMEAELLGGRLSVYCDEAEWLLVIEWIRREFGPISWEMIWCSACFYGNCLRDRAGKLYSFERVTDDLQGPPVFLNTREDPIDPDLPWINRSAHTCLISDARTDLTPIIAPFRNRICGNEKDAHDELSEFSRAFFREYHSTLWCTPAEINQHVTGMPPKLLVLEDWWHPNFALEEQPSQSRSFQMIAECIAAGNAALYDHRTPTNMRADYWEHFSP